MFRSLICRTALLSVVVVASALAQDGRCCVDTVVHMPNEFEKRSAGNISFIQIRPVGALEKNIGFGYGANVAYLFRLDRAGAVSLRTDIGWVSYGEEHISDPLSSTISGRIRVKVSTTNSVVPLSLGPQLMWPTGPIRPYVNAGIGTQYFYTNSAIEDAGDDAFSTTNQSDWTSTWVTGAGVYIPVYKAKGVINPGSDVDDPSAPLQRLDMKILVDLGFQYVNGGRAQYLKPGSIQDLPNGQIRIIPLESETHMLIVRLGVRFNL
jgi:opacity protein-like surface antigen